MKSTQYPTITPLAIERNSDTRNSLTLRAVAIVAGGSALFWSLIVYAVWQVI